MIDSYYISDEDFKTAEANGIKACTVRGRVYNLGWSVERAITEPVKCKQRYCDKIRSIAESNGIPRPLLYIRIAQYKMSPYEASTRPISKRKNPHETEEVVRTYESNGITKGAFRWRMENGWSLEKAMTTPLRPHSKGYN